MTTDHKDLPRPKKIEPGNELHFALLGLPWHFNMLRGKDYADMQGFARAVWDAALEHDRAQRVEPAEVLEEAMRLAHDHAHAFATQVSLYPASYPEADQAVVTSEEAMRAFFSQHLGAQRVEQAEPVAGWVLVPEELTQEMLSEYEVADNAAFIDGQEHGASIHEIWDALLAAAPTTKGGA